MFAVYFLSLVGSQDTVSSSHFFRDNYVSLNDFQDLGWLSGDLIAGITVGIVLVPQSMSYATVSTFIFSTPGYQSHFSS